VILCTVLLAGGAIAQTKDQPKVQCPRDKPGFGVCVFNPEINCTGDDKCESGQLCCPDGCNRKCKIGVPAPKESSPRLDTGSSEEGDSSSESRCPPVPPTFGACVFKPELNCVDDNACKNGQVCCSDGCNKICRDAYGPSAPPSKVPSGGQCPPVPPTIGACVFKPELNCVDDDACKNGQVCCSDGCNKVCRDAFESSAPTKEVEETKVPSSNKCPAATPTFGACVFNPEVNCVDDDACKNGQICCSSGCNKVCVNPLPTHVHEATKP